MRCTNHPTRESSGYCPSCGDFFCASCLVLCEDGKSYCSSCRTKFDKKAKGSTAAVVPDTKLATKLLVKFKNGTESYGTTYKIDPDRTGFNFIPHTSKGVGDETYVEFDDVKYVALVASFKGEKAALVHEYQPKGSEVSVTFKDGELLRGYTLKRYSEREPRFSVIPSSAMDNRISTIVERSAVAHMALGRILKTQELRTLVDNSVKRLIFHYYWRHPDVVITLDEMATRLGRAAAIIDREIEDFIQEGLIQRIGAPSLKQMRFIPSKDPAVRQMLSALYKELDTLYFRKQGQSQAEEAKPKPAPPKPAIRWPL